MAVKALTNDIERPAARINEMSSVVSINSDEERLEYLFNQYEKMIQEEKEKDTLFAKEKKTRKRK